MNRFEESLDHFLNLMNEELVDIKRDESPDEFLLNLWHDDRERFSNVIMGSLKYMSNFRGMDDCIIRVCLSIGRDTKELIEEIILRQKIDSKQKIGLLKLAVLLGSEIALDNFREGFKESIALGTSYFDKVKVLEYVETIAFYKITSMRDLVSRLASMKEEQYHRKRKPLFWGIPAKLIPQRRNKWLNYLDDRSIKLAEAVEIYFTKGISSVKEYLNEKNNYEFRANAYLFCLACERNPDDYDYFVKQFKLYKDPMLKNMCLEAIIYVADSNIAAAFIDEELAKYDLKRLIKRKGYDFKIFYLRANSWLFYRLLESCFFLRTLNEGLITKLILTVKSPEIATSTIAMLILEKYGINNFNKKGIDLSKAFILKTSSTPAHLLSMARAAGRL